MDESRNSRHIRNLILRLFFIVFCLLLSGGTDYFLQTQVSRAAGADAHPLGFSLDHRRPAAFRHPGSHFGPLVVTGFLTLTDIYHTSYRNLVEPSKT